MPLLIKLLVVPLIFISLLLFTPLILREAFFRLPDYSSSFDCDDSALLTISRLKTAGITATPLLGNLKTRGEKYSDSDHVWVVANIFWAQVAIDRGVFCADNQHYEGFPLSEHQLLEFVAQDLRLNKPGSASPASQ
jgi:hypothetical protein